MLLEHVFECFVNEVSLEKRLHRSWFGRSWFSWIVGGSVMGTGIVVKKIKWSFLEIGGIRFQRKLVSLRPRSKNFYTSIRINLNWSNTLMMTVGQDWCIWWGWGLVGNNFPIQKYLRKVKNGKVFFPRNSQLTQNWNNWNSTNNVPQSPWIIFLNCFNYLILCKLIR